MKRNGMIKMKNNYKILIGVPYLENSKEVKELYIKLHAELTNQVDKFKDEVKLLFDERVLGLSSKRNDFIEYAIKNNIPYIIFLDADDMISNDFTQVMLKAIESGSDIYEAKFVIIKNLVPYDPYSLKNHVTGICYKIDLIKDLRFKENLQIGEDEDFSQRLMKEKKFKKEPVDCVYYYQFGFNRNCLSYRYDRGEISKYYSERGDNIVADKLQDIASD